MKFFETCIIAFMLITQKILADEQGASEAGEALEQYDPSERTGELLAQKITKRARIPQFVGKRDFYTTDDLSKYELTDDSQDIPIELEQSLHKNLLSSLLSGSSEDPQITDDAAQNDIFDREIRYRPMMVGRRSKWVPKFVGKRRGPLFVGRRRSPYFVGKRSSFTDEDMAEEKRRNPMFIGKRADPILVARGLSKPMFVGRRGHPIFVGRRRPSGDLDSSIFMGRRSVKYENEALSNQKILVEENSQNNASSTIYVNQKYLNQRIPPNVKRKQLKSLPFYNRRKRASDIMYAKNRRNFDVPYFVGKRNSIYLNKASPSKRSPKFEPPDFIGKRSQNLKVNQVPLRSHHFIDSPSLVNFKFRETKPKRFSSPDFVGKRFNGPYNIGKKRDFISPDFIGKRTPFDPTLPAGKRGQYFRPGYIMGKDNIIDWYRDSILNLFFEIGSTDFIEKQDRVLNSAYHPIQVQSGKSFAEKESVKTSDFHRDLDLLDSQQDPYDSNFIRISNNKEGQHFQFPKPTFEDDNYPEVTEFLPGLDDPQTSGASHLHDDDDGDDDYDITKRSNGKQIRFTPPEFIGKRSAIPKQTVLRSDNIANALLEHLGFYDRDIIKSNTDIKGKTASEKHVQTRPYSNNKAEIDSAWALGQPMPIAGGQGLTHVRNPFGFLLPSFLENMHMYLGNVQSEPEDSAHSSTAGLNLPERFLKTKVITDSVYNRQNPVFKVGSSEQDNRWDVSFMYEGQPKIGLYV